MSSIKLENIKAGEVTMNEKRKEEVVEDVKREGKKEGREVEREEEREVEREEGERSTKEKAERAKEIVDGGKEGREDGNIREKVLYFCN